MPNVNAILKRSYHEKNVKNKVGVKFIMLDERKLKAIELLVEGKLNRTEIAKEVGVTRPTLYNWEKEEEYSQEYDRLLHYKKLSVRREVSRDTKAFFENLKKISESSTNDNARVKATQLLLAYTEGNPENILNIKDDRNNDNVSKDVLEKEEEEWTASKLSEDE
ncbi:phBC6A51 family helix-turn-helix protein [Bacillus sp. KeR2]|uniref:phBC6A51 family helix-turn-helix protein n=2 Tax=Bacillus TaxID=1386 RepID=UPI00224B16B4|nr:phBC6A51 family helix-turn-helix protein [Bacillus sp. KeR2]MCX2853752.1 phBC6A51 family helix-turn-helix protein [Bacillus sp. KeR2]